MAKLKEGVIDFRQMRVCKEFAKGTEVVNPRTFQYPVDGDLVGLSVTCCKAGGYGQMLYMTASFYEEAYEDAVALDIKVGDLIDFKGYYEIDRGTKQDFHKCHVKNPNHIRFTPRVRKAKSREI